MILSILDGPDSQNGNERRRYLQIGLLALALLLVAVLGFRQVRRWMTPTQEVWVASSSLPAGATIGAENLKRARVAETSLPQGVLDARAIAGRELSRAKQEGEPFVRDDFTGVTEVEEAAIAEMVPEGRVLTTIRVHKELVPYKNLKSGDRVDIVSIDNGGRGDGFARVIARDAYVVGTMYAKAAPPQAQRTGLAALIPPASSRGSGGSPTVGLLLGLAPEDALPLAQATGSGDTIQVVLHGKAEVASGQLLELPERGAAGVEFIAGASRKRLMVTP